MCSERSAAMFLQELELPPGAVPNLWWGGTKSLAVTTDPRKVPALALLMIHLSCKYVASELLDMQAPTFRWVQSQAGLTSAQAA